ncbi:MAG TPA: hypothetical protein VGN86_11255 [Pyrinomonadaceae bacterium]|nr:hypothetical protein [Pyrinomonadaceae bacterium]
MKLFLASLLIFASVALSLAQNPHDNLFATVPEADRARISERLKLLIEYQVAQQWAKQYDLLSSSLRRGEGRRDFVNRTKEAFTQWGRKPLLEFIPYEARYVQVEREKEVLFIVGCSRVLDNGKKVRQLAVVEAFKEGKEWYFTEIETQGTGKDDDPCSEPPLPRAIALLGAYSEG